MEIRIHPYCEKCRSFCPVSEELYAGGEVVRSVTCKYIDRCERIEESIRRELDEKSRNRSGKDDMQKY